MWDYQIWTGNPRCWGCIHGFDLLLSFSKRKKEISIQTVFTLNLQNQGLGWEAKLTADSKARLTSKTRFAEMKDINNLIKILK